MHSIRSLVILSAAIVAFGCETTPSPRGGGGGASGGGSATSNVSARGSGGQAGDSSLSSRSLGGHSGESSAGTGGSGGASASSSSTSAGSGGHSGSSTTRSGSSAGTSSGFDPCPATGNCKVLPLGDSITYGSTSNNGGYRVELFSNAINDNKHITFVGSQSDGPNMVAGVSFPRNNEGHPGWTISQIDGIATTSNALKDSPQIILLHIGTNDLPNSLTGASDRLTHLIDKLLAALPSSLLVVAQIIPLPWAESSVVTYNAAIPDIIQQRASQGKHIVGVDMNTGFPTTNGYASDSIHPNDATGYPWMGDKWYAAIRQYLH